MTFQDIVDFYIRMSPNIKSSLVIITLLIIFLVIVGHKIKKQDPDVSPKGVVLLAEMLVSWVNNTCDEIIGEKEGRKFAPMILTFVIFIFTANISGLFGFAPPTANVAITIALGILAGLIIQIAGIKYQGIKNYLKGFLDPSPIMLPLNIISEIVTPFSLGMRLFGNILSGSIIMALIYNALLGIKIGSFPLGMIPALVIAPPLHAVFDIFFGAIQTYVFMLLTVVFVSGKMPEEE